MTKEEDGSRMIRTRETWVVAGGSVKTIPKMSSRRKTLLLVLLMGSWPEMLSVRTDSAELEKQCDCSHKAKASSTAVKHKTRVSEKKKAKVKIRKRTDSDKSSRAIFIENIVFAGLLVWTYG